MATRCGSDRRRQCASGRSEVRNGAVQWAIDGGIQLTTRLERIGKLVGVVPEVIGSRSTGTLAGSAQKFYAHLSRLSVSPKTPKR
ncbi:MAG: hypothetical protein HC769_37905 [Cyanobacteria bacterium CRU_2_1]|nr:hypothetical protein [Cyanobacteria bacterium CRU_2_1]